MVLLKHYSKKFLHALIASILVTPVFAGVLPLFNPNYITNQNKSFYVNANLFLTNDPFTLKDLFDKLETDTPHIKNGQNIALGDARADIGYTNKKYGYIGYAYREEVFITTNEESMELLYLATNKKELPLDKQFALYLAIKGFITHSVTYANSFDLYHSNGYVINVGFGIEALQGKDMQDGSVSGNATANSEKDYSFNAVASYDYTYNYLYDLDIEKASAYGYSFHLSLYIKKDNVSLLFLVNDIFGKLYWKNLPHSDVKISSHNKAYDSDGYVKYKATASGYEGYKDYIQILEAKYRLQLAYQYKKYLFKLGSDAIYGIYMPYLESDYKMTTDFSFGLGYETRFHSLTFKSKYKNFAFTIRADDLLHPSTLGIHISYLF